MIIDTEEQQEPKKRRYYRQAPNGHENSSRWKIIPDGYKTCDGCEGRGNVRGDCTKCVCIQKCDDCKGTGVLEKRLSPSV